MVGSEMTPLAATMFGLSATKVVAGGVDGSSAIAPTMPDYFPPLSVTGARERK
jgi:hypothetical protein